MQPLRRLVALLACALIGPFVLVFALAGPASAAETWGPTTEIPGIGGSGGLDAVSCAGVECTAVGNTNSGPFYAVSTGGVWAASVTLPAVPDLPYVVNAVSCTSPGNCTAVGSANGAASFGAGQPLYVTESAGVWGQPVEVPVPGPDRSGELNAVSCTSPTTCTAVGEDNSLEPLYVTETSAGWGDPTEVFAPDGSGALTAVSCPDASDCTAVGNDASGGGNPPFYLIESAGAWGSPVGSSAGDQAVLNGVSCSSPTACTAVGSDGNGAPIVETETDGALSSSEVSDSATGQLSSVSCSDASNCTAVGGDGQPMYATETAGTWSSATDLGTGGGSFAGVGCPDQASCVAVGTQPPTAGGSQAIRATESGGSWGAVTIQPFVGSGAFNAVSCPGAGDCVALGTDGNSAPAVATESGHVWGALTEVPLSGTLSDLSCTDLTDCTAVGSDGFGPSVAVESAGNWGAPISLPGPNGNGSFSAVSCTDALDCTAVGTDDNPIYATEVAGTWGATTELPAPSNSGGALLQAVSCSDANDCTAVGIDYNQQSIYVTEVAGTWGPVVELPVGSGDGASSGQLNGVACTGPGDCTAVGNANINGGPILPTYVTETGGTWGAITQLPVPSGSGDFRAISCVTATDCTAVGAAENAVPIFSTSASGAWSVPFDLGAPNSGHLDSVSCPSVTDCVAVGADATEPIYTSETNVGGLATPTVAVQATGIAEAGSTTYAVSVTGTSRGGFPSGTVSLTDNQTHPARCSAILTGGQASCALTEPAGTWQVTASYSGDGNYAPTTATTTTDVRLLPTLHITPRTAIAGYNSYVVGVTGRVGAPSGQVTLTDNEATPASCSGTLNAKGQLVCQLFQLASTTAWTVTAAYGGDANYGPLTSSTSVTIAKASLTLPLSRVSPGVTGSVTYAVKLVDRSGIAPTGTMTVTDDHGGSCTYPVSVGVDSCSIVESAGIDNITATYSGDANYIGGTTTKAFTTAKASPGMLLSAAPKAATTPGPVTYSVTVGGGAGPAPTGTVAVSDGLGGTCTVTLVSGAGSCAITEPEALLTVTFSYGGDANYKPETKTLTKRVS